MHSLLELEREILEYCNLDKVIKEGKRWGEFEAYRTGELPKFVASGTKYTGVKAFHGTGLS